jgi:ubiquitin-like protein Pup
MASEQSKGERTSSREDEQVDSAQLGAEAVARANQQEQLDEATNDIDDLLDSIDEVLEENAQEFVNAYVQKGGQ